MLPDFSGSSGCILLYSLQTVSLQASEVCLWQETSVSNSLVQPVLGPQVYKDGGGDSCQTLVTGNVPVPIPEPHADESSITVSSTQSHVLDIDLLQVHGFINFKKSSLAPSTSIIHLRAEIDVLIAKIYPSLKTFQKNLGS